MNYEFPKPFTYAGLSEVALVIIEGITHVPVLPIGGSSLTQLGAILGIGVIATEVSRLRRGAR